MYKLATIDLTDAFIYADVFDEKAYRIIKESEDLEELTAMAIQGFKIKNPSFRSYQDWDEKAEDIGYEVEIFGHDSMPLFRASMILLSPQVEIALMMALRHHKGQIRKADGNQYIIHILEISKLLYDNGGMNKDRELIAASLCHDLLEDTKCPESEIEEWCGKEVLRIVKAVTNDDSLSWEEKKLKYIRDVKAGGEKAMMVCLADKIVNLRSLLDAHKDQGDEVWKHFNRGREDKLWFENAVLAMLKENLKTSNFSAPMLLEWYEKKIGELEGM